MEENLYIYFIEDRGKDIVINYIRGFSQLKSLVKVKSPDLVVEIATLESRFLKNQEAEKLFGSSENTRNEGNQIIHALNQISWNECRISFVDLCMNTNNFVPQNSSMVIREAEHEIDKKKYYGLGKKWAVLVGANYYEDEAHYGNLKVCVNDVHAIADCLKEGNFRSERIHVLSDNTTLLPSRNNVLKSLKAIANATDQDDLFLFYYSGHGDMAEDEAYLVARDGHSIILPDTGISISQIIRIMGEANAKAKVIILDACHSGANIMGKGSRKMTPEFIERVFVQAEGIAIIGSCKQNELSYEWRENEQSVFTYYLLDALSGKADYDAKNFVTVQDVNRHVSDGVRLWASQKQISQTPTLEYKGTGDIILINL